MTTQPVPIQPQDRRPKKAAQRAQTRKQKQIDAEAVGIRIDGVEYVINPNDLTGRMEFEIRRDCGMGIYEIADAMQRTGGIDFLGMFMWACKRSRGEDVDMMDVLDSVSAGSDAEMMDDAEIAAAFGAAPKASGSAS